MKNNYELGKPMMGKWCYSLLTNSTKGLAPWENQESKLPIYIPEEKKFNCQLDIVSNSNMCHTVIDVYLL